MPEPHIGVDGGPTETDAKPDTVVANLPHLPGSSSTQGASSTILANLRNIRRLRATRAGATGPRHARCPATGVSRPGPGMLWRHLHRAAMLAAHARICAALRR